MVLDSVIGAGTKVIGGVLGGIFGANSAKKQKKMIEAQQADNQRWYDRKANEIGTERADAQAALTEMRNAQAERMANARGASAVGGASAEAMANEKASANAALGNAISTINATQEQRKDAYENTYLGKKDALNQQLLNTERRKAQYLQQATQGLQDVGGSLIDGKFGLKSK